MTKEKNIELTSEEQALLQQNAPEIWKGIEEGKSVSVAIAQAWLAAWRREHLGMEAKAQAKQIMQEVVAAGPEEERESLLTWCGFPTDMTRVSPFFPMNRNEIGKREYLEEHVVTSRGWGEVKYTGPKLSTYEEDALLALLAAINTKSSSVSDSYVIEGYPANEDRSYTNLIAHIAYHINDISHLNKDTIECFEKTLTYKGPLLPILRILHGKRNPTKKDYENLIRALKRLTVGGLEISISAGKTKSGKHRAPRITQMAAMLAGVFWDDKKKELTATINPFFYETYLAGRVTLIDVAKRMSLKGVISKALYRFVQSHRQNPVFAGHYLTLADTLNMDRGQPAYQLRRQLKTAINELIRQCVLMKKSGFVDTDIIKLNRTPEALPPMVKKGLKAVEQRS